MGEQQWGLGQDATPQICSCEFVLAFVLMAKETLFVFMWFICMVNCEILSQSDFTFVLGEKAKSFKTNN